MNTPAPPPPNTTLNSTYATFERYVSSATFTWYVVQNITGNTLVAAARTNSHIIIIIIIIIPLTTIIPSSLTLQTPHLCRHKHDCVIPCVHPRFAAVLLLVDIIIIIIITRIIMIMMMIITVTYRV
eukprot:COSAG01_NODE_3561_length_5931_cov_4.674211_2_plen_126_part_00